LYKNYNIKIKEIMTKQILSAFLGITLMIMTGCNSKKQEVFKTMNNSELANLKTGLVREFERLTPQSIRPAEGYLKYPYLIPAGFYKQMWDWDGFFIANHLASTGKPEYLKYWALNLIAGIDSSGYTAGCATTEGPRKVFGDFAMKPFLSQGVYFYARQTGDFAWIEPHYDALMKSLEYRDKTQLDTVYNCYFWENAGQSGADNNPAMNYFDCDTRSFLAPDASTFQLREIIAQALIAKELGKNGDYENLTAKAAKLEEAINNVLWCEEDQIYYTVDRETGDFYRRVSYASFIPLIQKLAPEARGKEMIKRYLINPEHMKAKFGYRSLSVQDPDYNNKNIIIPFSNWQGPVWPIANYLYSIGLKNYAFDDELRWQAGTLGTLLLGDIKACDSMHENYHADTGAPLAPADDYVDVNGKFVGFIGWNLCTQNIIEGVTENKWMLLELKIKN
jgi:alpha,alpha-trehalase